LVASSRQIAYDVVKAELSGVAISSPGARCRR
jgi:hypothetical protein